MRGLAGILRSHRRPVLAKGRQLPQSASASPHSVSGDSGGYPGPWRGQAHLDLSLLEDRSGVRSPAADPGCKRRSKTRPAQFRSRLAACLRAAIRLRRLSFCRIRGLQETQAAGDQETTCSDNLQQAWPVLNSFRNRCSVRNWLHCRYLLFFFLNSRGDRVFTYTYYFNI